MSERLEQWKAREKIRSDIGWAAVLLGLFGALAIAGGITDLLQPPADQKLITPLVSLALGLALGVCAVGLWKVQSWARWTAAFLFSAWSLGAFLEGQLCILPFVFFAAVYLFLPSTDRTFARVRGLRRKTPTPTAPDP